jgi:nitrogen fixation-related uncharacterized protein
MKRLVYIAVIALVAIAVAVAAAKWPSGAGAHESAQPPTTASLMDAYVQAGKLAVWRQRMLAQAEDILAPPTPPTTASLMDAYVQAAKLGYR